jgi:hypothetical protein
MTNQNLPDSINGIPTSKNKVAERRKIVITAYLALLNKLGKKTIHNNYLNVDIHLLMHEGGKEATNRSAFNW